MEFQEFCKNFKRMCCNFDDCSDCGMKKIKDEINVSDYCEEFCVKYPQEAERAVEQWAKENPVGTNADKFREVFGIELKSSEKYEGYCLLVGNNGIAKDSEDWLNHEYKEPEVDNDK